MDDVNTDSWIDFNSIDEIEAKMSKITGRSKVAEIHQAGSNTKEKAGISKQEIDLKEMNNMMSGLESFVKNKSDIEGIANMRTAEKMTTHARFDPNTISPKIFLTMLHDVLKAESTDDMLDLTKFNTDSAISPDDNDLLQYFTREDLAEDEVSIDDDDMGTTEGNNNKQSLQTSSMADIMKAMDEELIGESNLDRSLNLPNDNTNKSNGTGNDSKDLPFDDPTAVKSNVLSNLLESLDAQNGNAGPVSTIFKEMGINAPGEIS